MKISTGLPSATTGSSAPRSPAAPRGASRHGPTSGARGRNDLAQRPQQQRRHVRHELRQRQALAQQHVRDQQVIDERAVAHDVDDRAALRQIAHAPPRRHRCAPSTTAPDRAGWGGNRAAAAVPGVTPRRDHAQPVPSLSSSWDCTPRNAGATATTTLRAPRCDSALFADPHGTPLPAAVQAARIIYRPDDGPACCVAFDPPQTSTSESRSTDFARLA
jgi:hypothetical protein